MCLLEAMRPFEAALLDYLAGRPVKLLIEAAQGVKDVHPTAIYAHPYEKWPVLHQQMVRLARGLVLDLGCGVGRHLLYLQAKGLQVVGLEIAPGLAKACSERGAEHVMVADMRCLPFRDASFDTIMCLGNTLGVGGSPAGVLAILRELLRIARPGGLLLVDAWDPTGLRLEGPLIVRIRFVYGQMVGPWFDFYNMAPREAISLIREAGWRVERLLCDKVAELYGVVARKPD